MLERPKLALFKGEQAILLGREEKQLMLRFQAGDQRIALQAFIGMLQAYLAKVVRQLQAQVVDQLQRGAG